MRCATFSSPVANGADRHREARLVLALFLGLAVLFFALPEIDLKVSGLFWQDGHWLGSDNPWWLSLPYEYVPKLGRWLLVALLLLLAMTLVPRLVADRASILRRQCAFLLIAAAIGQGLLIDVALKDHLGRARPMQLQQWGGDSRFTPAFVPSDQCASNCSFVSGHVGGAAFLMGFGWLGATPRRRRWLLVSIAAAGYLGFCRIAQGGHFLSDAIFAWFATYFSLWLTEWAFIRLHWLRQPA